MSVPGPKTVQFIHWSTTALDDWVEFIIPPNTPQQWSFRKTETMGRLASQVEIGVWVQAPGALLRR